VGLIPSLSRLLALNAGKWSASVAVFYLLPFGGRLNGPRTDLCFVTERDFPVSCREWKPDRLASSNWYAVSMWSFLFASEIYLWGRTANWKIKELQKSVATVTKWCMIEVSVICGTNFADKRRSLGQYSLLADSSHGVSVSVTRAWISLCKSVRLEFSWQTSLRRGVVSPTLNPETGGPPHVGCLLLLIQYIRSCLPFVEAALSIRNPRKRHVVIAIDPPNMEFKVSAWICIWTDKRISLTYSVALVRKLYHCWNNFNRLVPSNHIIINCL
jgi:hypothetical protein